MSTKKKTAPAKPVNNPKYRVGNKLYFIDYQARKSVIKHGEVNSVITETIALRDNSTKAITGTDTRHIYGILVDGTTTTTEVSENYVYTSLPAVALYLAKNNLY